MLWQQKCIFFYNLKNHINLFNLVSFYFRNSTVDFRCLRMHLPFTISFTCYFYPWRMIIITALMY